MHSIYVKKEMSIGKSVDIIRELESGEEIKVCKKIASTVSTLLQNSRSDVIRSREKLQYEPGEGRNVTCALLNKHYGNGLRRTGMLIL